jgi:hypothetical protein
MTMARVRPAATVVRRIALDVAAVQQGKRPKVIASTLRRYLEAADVTPTQLQFDRLVAAISDGSI